MRSHRRVLFALLLLGAIASQALPDVSAARGPCSFTNAPPVYVRFSDTSESEFGPFAFVSVLDAEGGEGLSIYVVSATQINTAGKILAPSMKLATYDPVANLWVYDFNGRSGSSPYWQTSTLPLPAQ